MEESRVYGPNGFGLSLGPAGLKMIHKDDWKTKENYKQIKENIDRAIFKLNYDKQYNEMKARLNNIEKEFNGYLK